MLACFHVNVAFCNSEIHDKYCVLLFTSADQEIVGFDIAMNQAAFVDALGSRNHLMCHHCDGMRRERPVAEIEEVLKRGTEQVQDHDVVFAFEAKPVNVGHADRTLQALVDIRLIYQLLILAANFLQLNCHILQSLCMLALVHDAEAALAQLLLNFVLVCDYDLHRFLRCFLLLHNSIDCHANEILMQNCSG